MSIKPDFGLRPIKVIMQDQELKKALVEKNFEDAFAPVLFDDTFDDIREQDFFPELAKTIIDASTQMDDAFEAFMFFKNDGWYATGNELSAFEDLFRLVAKDRLQLLRTRAEKMGYNGPFAQGPLVFKACGSEEVFVGYQPDEMTAACEFVYICLDDGIPDRDDDGQLELMHGDWIDVETIHGTYHDQKIITELAETYEMQKSTFLHEDEEIPDFDPAFQDFMDSLLNGEPLPKDKLFSILFPVENSESPASRKRRNLEWHCETVVRHLQSAISIAEAKTVPMNDNNLGNFLSEIDSLSKKLASALVSSVAANKN